MVGQTIMEKHIVDVVDYHGTGVHRCNRSWQISGCAGIPKDVKRSSHCRRRRMDVKTWVFWRLWKVLPSMST